MLTAAQRYKPATQTGLADLTVTVADLTAKDLEETDGTDSVTGNDTPLFTEGAFEVSEGPLHVTAESKPESTPMSRARNMPSARSRWPWPGVTIC